MACLLSVFTLSNGVIGRLWSAISPLPGFLLCYFAYYIKVSEMSKNRRIRVFCVQCDYSATKKQQQQQKKKKKKTQELRLLQQKFRQERQSSASRYVNKLLHVLMTISKISVRTCSNSTGICPFKYGFKQVYVCMNIYVRSSFRDRCGVQTALRRSVQTNWVQYRKMLN